MHHSSHRGADRRATGSLAGLALLALTAPAAAAELTPAERAWLEGETDTRAVNEGELRFIPGPVPEGAFVSDNQLRITAATLDDGWVGLRQCLDGLDPVPALEVVYRYRALRDLTVTEAHNVAEVRVVGDAVQLEGVGPGARVCVRGEARILQRTEGGYRLQNGPYHRRFLDGYYPMHVILTVAYPEERLRLAGIAPAAGPGIEHERAPGRARLSAYFEGRLSTEFSFRPRRDGAARVPENGRD